MSEPSAPNADSARADLRLVAASDTAFATSAQGTQIITDGLRALASLRDDLTDGRWVARRTPEVEASMLPGEIAISFDGYRTTDAHLVVAAVSPATLDAAEAFLTLALDSDDGPLRVKALDAAGDWLAAAVAAGTVQ